MAKTKSSKLYSDSPTVEKDDKGEAVVKKPSDKMKESEGSEKKEVDPKDDERNSMHKRHEEELTAMHERHKKDVKEMHKRHEKSGMEDEAPGSDPTSESKETV